MLNSELNAVLLPEPVARDTRDTQSQTSMQRAHSVIHVQHPADMLVVEVDSRWMPQEVELKHHITAL